jgi:hypothetical protein
MYDYTRIDRLISRFTRSQVRNPNDTITRAELKVALGTRQAPSNGDGKLSFGYYTPDALADSIVDGLAYTVRRRVAGDPLFPGESLTFAELTESLIRLNFADYTTPRHVQRIYDDVKRHREPVWQYGDIVTSASGGVFSRLSTNDWKNYTTGATVDDNYPQRPLTKIGVTA